MIRFYNTLSASLEPFSPIEKGRVKLYTCGPTVYDFPHIGNWRAYVFEDLLKRFLMFSGYRVIHVMNLTDVDDKTIRGAKDKGISLDDYTRPFIQAFYRERDSLNIIPADHYPRATQHIKEMVDIIKVLMDKGFAYRKDGSIYFAVDKFAPYGRLSKIDLENLRPGSRGDADEYEKESIHDFALWKAPKAGEPSWETEIGTGRPGWHIECSAMSTKYLGPTFDIHCGGVDNIFPHHENEIAQSEAAFGVKFVNYWLHCHHLIVDGEKMSKSKGNFFTLADLAAKGIDPLDVRFLLLSTHYRKMLNFTFNALEQATAARRRIGNFLGDLGNVRREAGPNPAIDKLIENARAGFTAGLEDDLNISEALASLFGFISTANRLNEKGEISKVDAARLAAFVMELDTVILGIKPPLPASLDNVAAAGRSPYGLNGPSLDASEAEIMEKIEARNKARADKNFELADLIRSELLEKGIILEDMRSGVRWKRIRKKS